MAPQGSSSARQLTPDAYDPPPAALAPLKRKREDDDAVDVDLTTDIASPTLKKIRTKSISAVFLINHVVTQIGSLASSSQKWGIAHRPENKNLLYWQAGRDVSPSMLKHGTKNQWHSYCKDMALLQSYYITKSIAADRSNRKKWIDLLPLVISKHCFQVAFHGRLHYTPKEILNMKPNDYSTKLIEAIAQKNAAAVSASILAKGNQKFDDFVKKVDLFYASPKEQRAGDLLFEHEGFTELPKLSKMPKAEERGIVSIDVKKQLAQEVFQSKAAFQRAFKDRSPKECVDLIAINRIQRYATTFIVEALLSRSSEKFHVLWLNDLTINDIAEGVVRGMLTEKEPERLKRSDLFSKDQLRIIEQCIKDRNEYHLNAHANDDPGCKYKDCNKKGTRGGWCNSHYVCKKGSIGKMSQKLFFRQMATNAYIREKKEKSVNVTMSKERRIDELSEMFRLKVAKNPDCNLCGVSMNVDKYYPRDMKGRKSGVMQSHHYYLHATNASPDRIKPNCRGDGYVPDNVQMLCCGCQMAKSWFSQEEAITLFYHLGHKREQATISPVKEYEQQTLIIPWVKRQLKSIKYRCDNPRGLKAKKCFVDLDDLFRLVSNRWAGNGYVFDYTGAILPLLTQSFDRKDSEGHYAIDNLQMMTIGYNLLKCDAQTSARIDNLTARLRKSERLLSLYRQLDKEGRAVLPLAKATEKIMALNEEQAEAEVETQLEAFAHTEEEYNTQMEDEQAEEEKMISFDEDVEEE